MYICVCMRACMRAYPMNFFGRQGQACTRHGGRASSSSATGRPSPCVRAYMRAYVCAAKVAQQGPQTRRPAAGRRAQWQAGGPSGRQAGPVAGRRPSGRQARTSALESGTSGTAPSLGCKHISYRQHISVYTSCQHISYCQHISDHTQPERVRWAKTVTAKTRIVSL